MDLQQRVGPLCTTWQLKERLHYWRFSVKSAGFGRILEVSWHTGHNLRFFNHEYRRRVRPKPSDLTEKLLNVILPLDFKHSLTFPYRIHSFWNNGLLFAAPLWAVLVAMFRPHYTFMLSKILRHFDNSFLLYQPDGTNSSTNEFSCKSHRTSHIIISIWSVSYIIFRHCSDFILCMC